MISGVFTAVTRAAHGEGGREGEGGVTNRAQNALTTLVT